MTIKILTAVVAVALLLAYFAPMVFKMNDVALTSVIVIGIVVMLADLWYTLHKLDE